MVLLRTWYRLLRHSHRNHIFFWPCLILKPKNLTIICINIICQQTCSFLWAEVVRHSWWKTSITGLNRIRHLWAHHKDTLKCVRHREVTSNSFWLSFCGPVLQSGNLSVSFSHQSSTSTHMTCPISQPQNQFPCHSVSRCLCDVTHPLASERQRKEETVVSSEDCCIQVVITEINLELFFHSWGKTEVL